jgi:hypothetical protein
VHEFVKKQALQALVQASTKAIAACIPSSWNEKELDAAAHQHQKFDRFRLMFFTARGRTDIEATTTARLLHREPQLNLAAFPVERPRLASVVKLKD